MKLIAHKFLAIEILLQFRSYDNSEKIWRTKSTNKFYWIGSRPTKSLVVYRKIKLKNSSVKKKLVKSFFLFFSPTLKDIVKLYETYS